jgi:hypothetical protein
VESTSAGSERQGGSVVGNYSAYHKNWSRNRIWAASIVMHDKDEKNRKTLGLTYTVSSSIRWAE